MALNKTTVAEPVKPESQAQAVTEPELPKPAPTAGSIDLGGEETEDSKIENV